MIAVISEVWPQFDRKGDYDALATAVRPRLESMDSFLATERFESCSKPGEFLSLSLWRDEAALAAWRNLDEHRAIMRERRDGILRDYHIRACQVPWGYSLTDRADALADSRAVFG